MKEFTDWVNAWLAAAIAIALTILVWPVGYPMYLNGIIGDKEDENWTTFPRLVVVTTSAIGAYLVYVLVTSAATQDGDTFFVAVRWYVGGIALSVLVLTALAVYAHFEHKIDHYRKMRRVP